MRGVSPMSPKHCQTTKNPTRHTIRIQLRLAVLQQTENINIKNNK